MDELITIIINVYNGEKYISKCLESIINQTYRNIEILIVNDGSTDNTLNICTSYKDNRIRIINQENMGLSLARNVGIENSKGEYLYFIDSDDFVQYDVVEYLYNLCKKYKTLMATCKPIDVYNYNNAHIKSSKEQIEVISSKDMLKKILLSEDRAVNLWNKLIHKNIFNNIRFENRPINDVAVTYKLALATNKIAYSNQIKYYYLRHKDSITISKQKNVNRSIDKYNVCMERYNYIKNLYPNFIENDIGMLRIVPMLYDDGTEELCKYLDDEGAIKLFKKLFTFKVLTCKLNIKEKIKIVLFRINPKLSRWINNKYNFINKSKI